MAYRDAMRTNHTTGWPAHARPGGRRGGGSPIWLSVKVGVPQVLITYLASQRNVGRRDVDALALALLALGPLALAWRRRLPVAVLGVYLAATEVMRTREEEARRRASDERLRIARELHDVVAHNISLINVQASTALHLIDERPEQARTALAAIKQASKEALGELRSVLDILRQSDEEPPRAPAPGLARLDELVSKVKAAGLEVRTTTEGDSRPLPAPVDLTAFRIVQEALTNVHRHAGRASATVRVSYRDRDLVVQVDDDGRGASSNGTAGGGNGIPGMRERVAALGGELEAGPRAGGGFRVLARLPLDGEG